MKVVEVRGAFGVDHLEVVDRIEPAPGPGEVLLRMRAASLNYRDLLMVRGLYNPRQPLPLIPCSDGVGEVIAVGAEVSSARVGKRVATLFCQGWLSGEPTREKLRATLGGPLDGSLAELMILPESGVVPVPDHLSDEEAATLSCAGLTAWSAVVTQADLRPGDTVLVLGTGGVALFALQFARLLGARVIVTSSSDAKLARAEELGATAGLNYRENPEWWRPVVKLTHGRGVDLVVEVGGAETLPQSLRAVRPGGQISLVGNLTGGSLEWNIIPVFMRRLCIQGILVGHRESFEAMNRAIRAHRMRPVIDRVFPFDEPRAAFDYLAAAGHFGKICLQISDNGIS
jgi:NADPH:quinone reductase-like Zn-dependent oxidoreductase